MRTYVDEMGRRGKGPCPAGHKGVEGPPGMDSSDALKAFLSLPAMATLERHKVEPGDIAILRLQRQLSESEIASISALWQEVLPEVQLLILDEDASLEFVRKGSLKHE